MAIQYVKVLAADATRTHVAWQPMPGSFTVVSVSGGGTITLTVGELCFVDNSGGPCTVNAPAPVAGGEWGVSDVKHGTTGTWTATNFTDIPNAGGSIEDPNNPGTYTTNPIKLEQPNQLQKWIGDPGGTYWKAE